MNFKLSHYPYYGFTGIIESGSVTRITSAFNLAVNNN